MNQLIDLAARRASQKFRAAVARLNIPFLTAQADRDARAQRAIERANARWHEAAEERGCSLDEVRNCGDAGRFMDEELRREGL